MIRLRAVHFMSWALGIWQISCLTICSIFVPYVVLWLGRWCLYLERCEGLCKKGAMLGFIESVNFHQSRLILCVGHSLQA